jgi:H+/Cl- antiporter ClcA
VGARRSRGGDRIDLSRAFRPVARAGRLVVLITRTRVGVESFGALAGAGAVLLLIAYIHRGEQSGWHCSTTPDSVECGEGIDPRPWLIAGLLLVGISVALVARRMSGRTTRRL